MAEQTYETISNPYNKLLQRGENSSLNIVDTGAEGNYGAPAKSNLPTPGGVSGGSLGDIWIENWIKSKDYKPKTYGFYLDGKTGYIECMNLYVKGSIVGSSLDIPDTTTANSFHVDSNGNSWWGSNVATGYAGANAFVLNTGEAFFNHVHINGGANATFISDSLNTSAKNILSDFNFGAVDYAGAVKSGNIAWNTTTGVITSGSGVVVYRGGIVGASAGVTTFSIDATTGSAFFKGQVAATSGYFGDNTNGIQVDSNGLLIVGTGYIRTASTGSRVEMVRTGSGGYNNALYAYDSSNNLFFRVAADGGSPPFSMFGTDSLGCAQFTNASTTCGFDTVYITAAGLQHALNITTSGLTARSDKSALYISNAATNGYAINVVQGSDNTEDNIYVQPNTKHLNILSVAADGSTSSASSRINNKGFCQFPAYYHCSDFDENIADGTALASTVIANAYWIGSGTSGTQAMAVGTTKDESTYITLSTTATGSRSSILTFNRYFNLSYRDMALEFRVRPSNITNTAIKFGIFYDSTHYAYFIFDTDVHASQIYFASNNGSNSANVSTLQTLATNVWSTYRMHLYNTNDYSIYINDSLQAGGTQYIPVSSDVQPYIYIDNKAADEEKKLYVDYVKIWAERYNSQAVS